MSKTTKLLLLIAISIFVLFGTFLLDPIAQNPHYHDFADQRSFIHIDNFLNVTSNLGFVIVGLSGIRQLNAADSYSQIKFTYRVLFFGLVLTGFGSAFYHLQPDNFRLVWDRLPMTIVFMAFLSAIISERVSLKAGAYMLWPLLGTGIASVAWWYYTETQGAGDLRPYALVQFYPMLLIPLILILFKAPSPDVQLRALFLIIIFYAFAKICEHFDQQILEVTNIISGHSLKHIFASISTLFILVIYKKRRIRFLSKSKLIFG